MSNYYKKNKLVGDVCLHCKKLASKCTCAKDGKGAKFSHGKTDWTLLPVESLEGTVKVLEHGARKYARNNWQNVPDAKQEYIKAFWRHIMDIKKGEQFDKDSKLHHWHHIMCNAVFICWFLQQEVKEGKKEEVIL